MAKSTRGKPLKKPWKLASNHPGMLEGFDKRCVHQGDCLRFQQPHVRVQGQDTKMTEGYTDEMAVAVHRGHKDHVYGPAKL